MQKKFTLMLLQNVDIISSVEYKTYFEKYLSIP